MLKNVAGQRVGAQLVSASDGSAFTGSVTVAVTVDAGTQATGSVGSGACTHEGGGYHTYAPAQAETNGDLVAYTFSGTGAVPVTIQIYTRPATGLLAPTVAGRTLDVSAGGEAGIDWANVGSPTTSLDLSATTISTSQAVASVSGAVGSVTSATSIATAVWASATRTLTAISDSSGITTLLTRIVGTLASGTHNAQSGDAFARLGAPVGLSISADIATRLATSGYTAPDNASITAIKSKTDNLPASPAATSDIATALGTGTWATAIPWNAAWDAEVQSECTDALNAYDPPTNAEMEARTLASASYATAATQTTIVGHVDTLETEVAKVIKSGESRTIARAGETSITFTETRA